jgi:hypothetical protein
MTEPRPYFEACAVVSGWPAHVFADIIAGHRDALEGLPLRSELEDSLDALRRAGEHWISASRNVAAAQPEIAVSSEHEYGECTCQEAADALNMTDRRVQQLAKTGRLAGKQKAGRWIFDRGAVIAFNNERGADHD